MVKTYNQSPYYDDYDPSKGYNTILARSGEVLQAREWNTLQSTVYDHLGRIASTILRDGNIVSGCSLIIRNNVATISSGQIYFGGLIHNVDESTISITGVGSETIGVTSVDELVTEAQDASLRDPAQGFENQGQPGAHRNRTRLVYKLNDNDAAPVYSLTDGSQTVEVRNPELDVITDQLARRTYDESGNYKVSGLLVQNRVDQSDPSKVALTLTSGKAYIKGYEISKPTNSRFLVRKSNDITTSLNEQKRYVTGTLKYPLNNKAAKEILRVTMDVFVEKRVTRGPVAKGRDVLVDSNQSVVSILEVFDTSRSYTYGNDFFLDENNTSINWNVPTGREPMSGASYTVRMVVTMDLTKSQYRLGTEAEGLVDYLVLSASAPVPYIQANTQFTGIFRVEYEFYYARRDLVMLTKTGEIEVLEGTPDLSSRVESPINQDDNKLVVASITVLPNANEVAVVNSADNRLTMEDLYRVVKRVADLEDNQAISDLDSAAQLGEDATRLNGVYTDGFINANKCDLSHPEFDAAIDLDMGELTVSTETGVLSLNVNTNSSGTSVGTMGRVISAPFTNVLALSQSVATNTMLVNPYAVFNPMSLIALNPAVDNWIDESKVVITNEVTKAVTLRRWWAHRGEPWAEEEKRKWIELGFTNGADGQVKWTAGGTHVNSSQSTSTSTFLDEVITYMRERDVDVTATNFLPGANSIKCYFDDRRVNLTPTGSTQAGSEAGTVRAGADGKFTARFRVPADVRCGTVEVRFENANNKGFTTYSAEGRKRRVTETVLKTNTQIKAIDPLAQSFMFDRDTILTRVGLYFSNKDSNKSVVVQVRNMVNGYPGNISYAETVVDASSVKVSSKGTEETIVQFNQPVYCDADTQYAICILSDSNAYEMFVAELGGTNLVTNNPQVVQPYEAGVLFSSSNALTWTAHQTMDLKFSLYKAEYNPAGGRILFSNVSTEVVNRILLATDYLDKRNAGISWEFSTDGGINWEPIENYVDRELGKTTRTVSLLATIHVINNSSPMIAGDSINLITFLDGNEFTYVSRNVGVDSPYTQLKVTVDSNYQVDPAISSLKVFYASDINGTVWKELTNPVISKATGEFNRFTYQVTGIPSSSNYRVKVYMKTSNVLARPRAKRLMSVMKY